MKRPIALLLLVLASCQSIASVEEKTFVPDAAQPSAGSSGAGGAAAGAGGVGPGAGTAGAAGTGGGGSAGAGGGGTAGASGGGAAGAAGDAGAAGTAGAAGDAGAAGLAGASGGGIGGQGGSGAVLRRPPPPPDGLVQPIAPIEDRYFVVRNFRFGAQSSDAWRFLGFDLDGLDTNAVAAKSADYGGCKKPAMGSVLGSAFAFEDGSEGIDNVFGAKIAPLIKIGPKSLEDVMNDGIAGNGPTLMFGISGLGADGDQSIVNISVWVTSTETGMGKPPHKWDGSDVFPVNPVSLNSFSNISDVKMRFVGYMRGHTVVSGRFEETSKREFLLDLQSLGLISLSTEKTVLSMELSADHKTVKNATLTVLMRPENLLSTFKDPLYFLASCQDSTYKLFEGLSKGLVDVADNGPSFAADPTQTCALVSFGMGLEMVRVQPPTEIKAVPPIVLCGAAGAAGSAGAAGAGGN